MKSQTLDIKIHPGYSKEELLKKIKKQGIKHIESYEIVRQSLDARKKNNIIWNLTINVNQPETNFKSISESILEIPKVNNSKQVLVIGTGPAGIFSALVLQRAGFKVTILEKGSIIDKRDSDIEKLSVDGIFNKDSNYAFGEGGAGTYSDGKLTSRSKHIKKEKAFMLATMINHGAPKEIYSMLHPHVGSDKLKDVCRGLREEFYSLGGEILFDTSFVTFKEKTGKITKVISTKGEHDCDYLLMATGHSSFDTYRELITLGVPFRNKTFALGFRAEHHQSVINEAQWGRDKLTGVKAAEYRLTAKVDASSVYSFCMCPGGIIVPAAAMEKTSIVNGMSYYDRAGEFANAAVVASFNYNEVLGRECSPEEALERLQRLEESYFHATGGFKVPAMKIEDFINGNDSGDIRDIGKTSYMLGTTPYDLKELLPPSVVNPLQEGLKSFSKKLKGYDQGNILGLESKTSSPIQVLRNREGLCDGYNNLYIVGEGSGWAGGIISSGGDGIKGAMDILAREC